MKNYPNRKLSILQYPSYLKTKITRVLKICGIKTKDCLYGRCTSYLLLIPTVKISVKMELLKISLKAMFIKLINIQIA